MAQVSQAVQMARWLAFGAAVFGLAAVVLAALGAHAIPLDSPAAERLWNTALQIHMFHAAAMLATAALALHAPAKAITFGGLLMALGTLMFSGSLYLRAAGIPLLPGIVAPAGGMVLVAAWLWLGVALVRKNTEWFGA